MEERQSPGIEEMRRHIEEMRQQYERDRDAIGEEAYADLNAGLARMEQYVHERAAAQRELRKVADAFSDQFLALDEQTSKRLIRERELGSDRLTWRSADIKLRDFGYPSGVVSRMIQYASFIQVRGWDALGPDQEQDLRKKFDDAGVDPMRIDFTR